MFLSAKRMFLSAKRKFVGSATCRFLASSNVLFFKKNKKRTCDVECSDESSNVLFFKKNKKRCLHDE